MVDIRKLLIWPVIFISIAANSLKLNNALTEPPERKSMVGRSNCISRDFATNFCRENLQSKSLMNFISLLNKLIFLVIVTPLMHRARKRKKIKKNFLRKKYKANILPLLVAYKLKFFTLIPVLIAGLVLLTGSNGLAGFFFAMFFAALSFKTKSRAFLK